MIEYVLIDQIQEAFDQFNRGQKYLYSTLTTTIKDNQTNDEYLIRLFNELHDHVDLFEQMNEQFLDFLQFQIDWTKQSKAVLDAFSHFQITVISSNIKHAERYLSFLFTLFTKPENSIHDFAHDTLQSLMFIVPLASTLLCTIAEQYFPFMTKDKHIQVVYVQNLLRSLNYLPIERLKFFEIVLTKLLRMDVHASRQDILQTEKRRVENEMVFTLEQSDDRMKHDQADKLDWLMFILFEYITNVSHKDGEFQYEQTELLFKDFLNIFNKFLSPTHDSSHVQFLIFYICSFHRDFSDEFINNCWKTFVSPSISMTFRQAAIYYLCSFIARANYIKIKSVLTITHSMVDWLHMYMSTTETNTCRTNPKRHLPFYAIFQAVLYIFVYRHREIARLSNGIERVFQWRLNHIMSSELNPLKFCLPTITLRFAQLARNYQIAFCYSIIETNRRYSLPEVFSFDNYSSTVPSQILHAYFPFDPYILKRSSIFIQPIYNEYQDESEDFNSSDTNENEDIF
ncbi:unnamed protein product [Adineta ricciae]|uniref:RNA polymerase I-specific transcription initiation factor RRN3 n=1 Tax=Adineta ricciae TaxID=249248 RepID=A0A815B3Z2_ADIRI|nr:unnamed protein product [Adineta ricciae]